MSLRLSMGLVDTVSIEHTRFMSWLRMGLGRAYRSPFTKEALQRAESIGAALSERLRIQNERADHQMNEPKPIEREAVAIIALRGHDVLLVKNRKRSGSIEIPGGSLLSGEGMFDGARRECREETGLVIGPSWRDLVPYHTKVVHGWRVYVMLALRWSGDLRAGDDAESVFFGNPELLLTGQRPEDFDTVVRALRRHERERPCRTP